MEAGYIRTDELLTTAAFRGELERVRDMLDHGAVSSAHDNRMCTALHWAASMGHVEVAALLIERGADQNARSVDGNSPLHVAAREGDADMAACLLHSRANPELCNSAGQTALQLALDFADDEVDLIHLLRRAQAEHAMHSALTDTSRTATADLASGEELKAQQTTRRKVQVVWEADLNRKEASATMPATDLSGTVDSACGPDEPLDVSDFKNDASEAEALARRAVSLSLKEDAAAGSTSDDVIDAAVLSTLMTNLFAWDAASKEELLPR